MTEDWRNKRIEADIRDLWRLLFYVMVCVIAVGFLALAALIVASK